MVHLVASAPGEKAGNPYDSAPRLVAGIMRACGKSLADNVANSCRRGRSSLFSRCFRA